MNLTDLAARIRRESEATLEANLRDAVTRHLGDAWVLADLQGRLMRYTADACPNVAVYCLDGKPILRVSPIPESTEALLHKAPVYEHV